MGIGVRFDKFRQYSCYIFINLYTLFYIYFILSFSNFALRTKVIPQSLL